MESKELAENLRKPTGDKGLKVGEFMHKGNANFYTQFLNNVDWSSSSNILEVGPGAGLHIQSLLESSNDASYTGLDYSETMVEACIKNNPNQTFVQGDVLDFKTDVKFDLILSINTVYFLSDLKKAFTNLKNCLSDIGVIHIGKRPKEDLELLNEFTQYGFIKYSNEEVIDAMMEVGFDVQRITSAKDESMTVNEQQFTLHSDFIIAKHGN